MGSSGAEWEDLQSMMNDWARAGVAPVAISVTDAMTIRALRMVGNGSIAAMLAQSASLGPPDGPSAPRQRDYGVVLDPLPGQHVTDPIRRTVPSVFLKRQVMLDAVPPFAAPFSVR
jgi:hypothetical protein